jgi:Eukaryotic aspartyl protease
VLGSLTFGGYDSSRFTPNNVTFPMASDVSRDLVVSLQSITLTDSKGVNIPLLPSGGIFTFVDSALPYIWLPLDACHAFEESFGLTWNVTSELYLVNDTLHSALVASNASVTFTLGVEKTGGATVDIVLPYASFDLTATPPLVQNTTSYFPLKRAANDTQYTLGRVFLQEA